MTVGRVAAFSDGVFAIAMTVLVLTIDVPNGIKTTAQLNRALHEEIPAVLSYALSFAVIGRYWMAHHSYMQGVRRVTNGFLGLNLLLLGLIALVPFPTGVLGNYGNFVVPTIMYACMVGSVGLAFGFLEIYTLKAGIARPESNANLRRGIAKSFMGPAVFFASIPIALFVGTAWAKYFWLVMLPVGMLIDRRHARTRDRAPAEGAA